MAFPTLCLADVTNLPAADQKMLRNISRFHEVHSATNLPPAILLLCSDDNERIAEPGQNWNPTDMVFETSVPQSRFIWAVTDGDYYVVHYESGGYGHSYNILVARWKTGQTRRSLIWRGYWRGSHPLRNYTLFLAALRIGRLEDSSYYSESIEPADAATLAQCYATEFGTKPPSGVTNLQAKQVLVVGVALGTWLRFEANSNLVSQIISNRFTPSDQITFNGNSGRAAPAWWKPGADSLTVFFINHHWRPDLEYSAAFLAHDTARRIIYFYHGRWL